MRSMLAAAVVAVVYTLLPSAQAQPVSNSSSCFCAGLAPGFYCNPADALNIVSCPDDLLIPCPSSRFCATVGPVPDCYQCESGFDLVAFCNINGAGTFCAPPETGSLGVWACPSGKEIQCQFGSRCAQIAVNAAICLAVNDDADLCPPFTPPCPPTTTPCPPPTTPCPPPTTPCPPPTTPCPPPTTPCPPPTTPCPPPTTPCPPPTTPCTPTTSTPCVVTTTTNCTCPPYVTDTTTSAYTFLSSTLTTISGTSTAITTLTFVSTDVSVSFFTSDTASSVFVFTTTLTYTSISSVFPTVTDTSSSTVTFGTSTTSGTLPTVCIAPTSATIPGGDQVSICLLSTIDASCITSQTNNIGASYCASYALPF